MGNEFLVNSYQNNWQRDANVLALRDGGFVVTWSSYLNNYDDSGVEATYVAAQFFDANGRKSGGELLLRGIDGAYSGTAQVTQLTNGNIVLTWTETLDHPIITTNTHIMAQVLTAKGTAVSSAFRVDTVNSSEAVAPDVTATGDGGFVVSFGASTATSLLDQVYYRSYTAAGAPRGADQALNVYSNQFDELVTKSAALTNGNSVVIWNSEAAINDGTDDGRNQIRASLLDASGKVFRSDFGLTPHFGGAGGAYSDDENFGYAVASRTGGGFVVVNEDWTPSESDGGTKAIYFSSYDANGRPTTGRTAVFSGAVVPGDLDITRLATGHYVITWDQQSLNSSRDGDDAYGVIVSASGARLSQVFEIGADRFDYDDQVDTSVAALAGGGFVVSYTSDSIDNDNEGIAARIFGRGTLGDDNLRVDVTGLLSGLAGNDVLIGDTRSNTINGDAGNDSLFGGGGNDLLNGGAGADRLEGGAGNDTYYVDNKLDKIVEAAGSAGGLGDIVATAVTYGLAAGVAVERLQTTNAAATTALTLAGNELGQTIVGNAGANAIYGKGGVDTLFGGGGNDSFFFTTAAGAGNVDTILDFGQASGNADLIKLENAVFTGLGAATGALNAALFKANAAGVATDSSDRIIYETDTGRLFYDADGNGVGASIQFAKISNFASLTGASAISAADFFVV